jgi:hypothetical protein
MDSMQHPAAGSASGAWSVQQLDDLWSRMDRARVAGQDPWAALWAWLDDHADPETDQLVRRSWPLVHCCLHGIPMGLQWGGLGWLAWRYARDFTASELAWWLWEVVEASDQDMARPWKRRQIENIAERAIRNREAADARRQEQMRAALAAWQRWPGSAAAWPRPKRRPERQPGARQRRKPGRAA